MNRASRLLKLMESVDCFSKCNLVYNRQLSCPDQMEDIIINFQIFIVDSSIVGYRSTHTLDKGDKVGIYINSVSALHNKKL